MFSVLYGWDFICGEVKKRLFATKIVLIAYLMTASWMDLAELQRQQMTKLS